MDIAIDDKTAHFHQRDQLGIHVFFRLEFTRVFTHQLIMNAGCLDGLAHRHAIVNRVHDDLGNAGEDLSRPCGPNAHVGTPLGVKNDSRRHGGKRAFARLRRVDALRVLGKVIHFIVEQETKLRHHDAAAAEIVNGIGGCHDVAGRIHSAEA